MRWTSLRVALPDVITGLRAAVAMLVPLALAHELAMPELRLASLGGWLATLADPERLARFVTFVNTPEADPQLVYIRERGQRRPVLTGADR